MRSARAAAGTRTAIRRPEFAQPMRGVRLTLRPRVRSDATHAGKFDRGTTKVDTGYQTEQIDLESFDAREREADHAADGHLVPGAAWRACQHLSERSIVLADRNRRKVQAELGYRTTHVRDERVAVRPGPRAVGRRVRIRRGGGRQFGDDRFGARAADVVDE